MYHSSIHEAQCIYWRTESTVPSNEVLCFVRDGGKLGGENEMLTPVHDLTIGICREGKGRERERGGM